MAAPAAQDVEAADSAAFLELRSDELVDQLRRITNDNAFVAAQLSFLNHKEKAGKDELDGLYKEWATHYSTMQKFMQAYRLNYREVRVLLVNRQGVCPVWKTFMLGHLNKTTHVQLAPDALRFLAALLKRNVVLASDGSLMLQLDNPVIHLSRRRAHSPASSSSSDAVSCQSSPVRRCAPPAPAAAPASAPVPAVTEPPRVDSTATMMSNFDHEVGYGDDIVEEGHSGVAAAAALFAQQSTVGPAQLPIGPNEFIVYSRPVWATNMAAGLTAASARRLDVTIATMQHIIRSDTDVRDPTVCRYCNAAIAGYQVCGQQIRLKRCADGTFICNGCAAFSGVAQQSDCNIVTSNIHMRCWCGAIYKTDEETKHWLCCPNNETYDGVQLLNRESAVLHYQTQAYRNAAFDTSV
jgi:hypothetical protein